MIRLLVLFVSLSLSNGPWNIVTLQDAIPRCGNGVIDPGEQCDPGMRAEAPCTPTCRVIDRQTLEGE